MNILRLNWSYGCNLHYSRLFLGATKALDHIKVFWSGDCNFFAVWMEVGTNQGRTVQGFTVLILC